MDRTPCPRCGDDKTVAGWTDGPENARSFQPDGIHWLRHLLWHFGETTHVRLPERFRACLACGLALASLNPEELRNFIDNHGTEEARHKLEPFRKESTPDREV